MKTNIGKIDTGLRVVAGLGILAAGYRYESFWGLIGLLPLFTAALGYCPAYTILGFNTCRREQK